MCCVIYSTDLRCFKVDKEVVRGFTEVRRGVENISVFQTWVSAGKWSSAYCQCLCCEMLGINSCLWHKTYSSRIVSETKLWVFSYRENITLKVEWSALLLCIWEATFSNLISKTGYPGWNLQLFFLVFPGIFQYSALNWATATSWDLRFLWQWRY